MKRMIFCALLPLTLASVSNGAHAQQANPPFAQPADAIEFRQDIFKELGRNFKRIADLATGKAEFDAKSAEESAHKAAELIKQPWAAFAAGTQGGKAKPEIWQQQDKFKDLQGKAEQQLAQLETAAKTGSVEALKAAFGPAAATCKACHDAFRD